MAQRLWLRPRSPVGWLIFAPAVALIVAGAVLLVAGQENVGSGLGLGGVLLSLLAQYVDSRNQTRLRTEQRGPR